MTIAKVVNFSDQISNLSESADFQLGDGTDAFHDPEVADIGHAVTNTTKFNNSEEFGTFGYDISSLFNTDKHAF